MSYIKVVKVKESIENLNQYMNIYQAINRLDWILKKTNVLIVNNNVQIVI